MKKYDLGVIDPPWDYDNRQMNDPSRGGIVYPTLTMKELMGIPIYKAFNEDSILVVWATMPKLMDSFYDGLGILDVIHAWKYRPVTALFVWIKENKSGGYYSGMGHYTNSNAEIAIIARRGKGIKRVDKSVKQLIFAPIGKHSEKPQEQYNRLDRLYPTAKKLEIFARKQNPPPSHWDATGLDYDGIDIREWIKQYE